MIHLRSAAAALGVGGFGQTMESPKKKVGLGRVGSRKALIMLDLSHKQLITQKNHRRHTCK